MAEAAFLHRSRKLFGNDEINNAPPPPPPPPFDWPLPPPFPPVPLPPVVITGFPTPPPPPTANSERSLILTIALPIFFAGTLLSCCLRLMSLRARRSRRAAAAAAAQPPQPPPQDGGEIYSGLMVDHPIWYIRTVGLHSSVINAIAVCKYKEVEALVGKRAECAVCLNVFQADDTLRIMPKCNHAFHVSCIDTWLKSHKNCPVCRAVIELVDVKYPGGASPRLPRNRPGAPGTPENNRREQGPETEDLEPRNNIAKDENVGE